MWFDVLVYVILVVAWCLYEDDYNFKRINR